MLKRWLWFLFLCLATPAWAQNPTAEEIVAKIKGTLIGHPKHALLGPSLNALDEAILVGEDLYKALGKEFAGVSDAKSVWMKGMDQLTASAMCTAIYVTKFNQKLPLETRIASCKKVKSGATNKYQQALGVVPSMELVRRLEVAIEELSAEKAEKDAATGAPGACSKRAKKR